MFCYIVLATDYFVTTFFIIAFVKHVLEQIHSLYAIELKAKKRENSIQQRKHYWQD